MRFSGEPPEGWYPIRAMYYSKIITIEAGAARPTPLPRETALRRESSTSARALKLIEWLKVRDKNVRPFRRGRFFVLALSGLACIGALRAHR